MGAGRRYTRVDSRTVEGFQHGEDDYWFRPVLFGKHLYTDLVVVPAGGSMAPHGHAGSPCERSLFTVGGTLEVTVDGETLKAGTSGPSRKAKWRVVSKTTKNWSNQW